MSPNSDEGDRQSGDLGKSYSSSPKAREFPLTLGRSAFWSIRPSANWMRPNHILEDNLLHLKSTNLNISLIQSIPLETFRLMFDQISGYSGPDNLTFQTNCRST